MANSPAVSGGVKDHSVHVVRQATTVVMTAAALFPIGLLCLWQQLHPLTLLIPLLLVPVFYAGATRFFEPLFALLHAAEQLRQGQFKTRALTPEKGPWRPLADTLHFLANELHERTIDFEAQVKERTVALERTAAQLRAVSTIGSQIAAVTEPTRLAPFVVRLMRGAFRYDVAAVFTLYPNHAVLSACAARDRTELPLGKAFSVDGDSAPAFMQALHKQTYAGPAEPIIDGPPVQHELAVLIKIGQRPLGILVAQSAAPFDEGDRFLCETIANQMAIALENARLLQAERHQKDAAIVDERNRMAREIHDTLAQGFMGIIMLTRAMRQSADDAATLHRMVDEAERLAADNLAEARRSVWNLRPERLVHSNLGAALADELQNIQAMSEKQPSRKNGALETTLDVSGDVSALSQNTETTLFRIAQASLRNALEHGRPNHIAVALHVVDDRVVLTVHDDGRGFDPTIPPSGHAHRGFGILSMKERAKAAGGHVHIASSPGTGCTVTVVIPTVSPPREVPTKR